MVAKLVFFTITLGLLVSANAVTYKCKDANGNWSEAACTGSLVPLERIKSSESWTPKIGMTQAEVERVIQSKDCYRLTYKWCGYHYVNRTQTAHGTSEQWVWVNARKMPIWYMYFTNGILTAIQE